MARTLPHLSEMPGAEHLEQADGFPLHLQLDKRNHWPLLGTRSRQSEAQTIRRLCQ